MGKIDILNTLNIIFQNNNNYILAFRAIYKICLDNRKMYINSEILKLKIERNSRLLLMKHLADVYIYLVRHRFSRTLHPLQSQFPIATLVFHCITNQLFYVYAYHCRFLWDCGCIDYLLIV